MWACSVKEIQVKILPLREKVGPGGDTEGSAVGGGHPWVHRGSLPPLALLMP